MDDDGEGELYLSNGVREALQAFYHVIAAHGMQWLLL
jgi:hypothetical protein